jgi:hypothetical protein
MSTNFLNTPTNLLGLLSELRDVCASIKLDEIDRLFARFGLSNHHCETERENYLKDAFGARRARFTIYIEDLELNSKPNPVTFINELSASFMRIVESLEMDRSQKEVLKTILNAEFSAVSFEKHHLLKVNAFTNNQAFALENERVCRTFDAGDYLAAAGALKSLIESACKNFLNAMGVPVNANANYKKLIYESQKALGLHPDQHESGTPIKAFLGSLRAPIEQIGEIRNQTSGTGAHGALTLDFHIDLVMAYAMFQSAKSWCEILDFKARNTDLNRTYAA